jgi:hypothetical protein
MRNDAVRWDVECRPDPPAHCRSIEELGLILALIGGYLFFIFKMVGAEGLEPSTR